MKSKLSLEDLQENGFEIVDGEAGYGFGKLTLAVEDVKKYIRGDIDRGELLVKSRVRCDIGAVNIHDLAKDTGVKKRIASDILEDSSWAKSKPNSFWTWNGGER